MTKGDYSKQNFVIVEDFLEGNGAPRSLQGELSRYASYFKDYSWAENAVYENYSNGAYIGEERNGKRHGIGMYVFNSGDLYIGEWFDGNRDGYGFYYSYSQNSVYYGEWCNGLREGKGHIWRPGYESEGIYSNGKEVRNMYVRNSSGYHSNYSSGSSGGNGGWCGIIVFVLILIWLYNIFF